MKISYRTHPILQKLIDGKLGVVAIAEEDREYFLEHNGFAPFKELWKRGVPYFASDILYITDPFFKAAQKAGPKLIELYRDILKSQEVPFEYSGTIIISGGLTYTFRTAYTPESDRHEIVAFCFHKHEDKPLVFAAIYSQTDGKDIVYDKDVEWHWWMSEHYKKSYNILSEEAEMIDCAMMFGRCVIIKMFKTYAQVETKHLKPNSKIKDEIGCKYINDTKLPITWLDSKWFTNLVKSDAFKVRGHFRLQACGKDLKDHKLIWITDFMKTGYTAPARKIKNQEVEETKNY